MTRARWRAALLLLALAGLVLWVPTSVQTSLDVEEIQAVTTSIAPGRDFLPAIRQLPGAAPLQFLVLRWLTAYGFEEGRMRAASLAAGAAAIAATGALVQAWFGGPQGIAAALLLALSPLHGSASQRALPYALCGCLVLLFALAIEKQLRGRGSLSASVAAAAVALYTSYAAFLAVAAALLHAATARWRGQIDARTFRRAVAACGLGLLLFVPWAAYDLTGPRAAQLVVPNVGWDLPVVLARAFGPGAAPGRALAALLFAGLASLGAVCGLRRGAPGATFAVAIALAGIGGTAGAARWMPYAFDPLQVLFVLPFYLALVAEGVAAMTAPLRASVLRWAATVVLAIGLAIFAYRGAVAGRSESASDWRAAALVVLRNIANGDAVAAPGGHRFLLYYAPELERRLAVARVGLLPAGLNEQPRVWLVAGWGARLHPHWDQVAGFLESRVVVDLSPARDPAVYYATLDLGRHRTYLEACHFDVPLAIWARQPLLRDCLQELGPLPSVLERIDDLARTQHLRLRNPALLQTVTLLWRAGKKAEAARLAEAVARREPTWQEALAAWAAVRSGAPTAEGPKEGEGQSQGGYSALSGDGTESLRHRSQDPPANSSREF